MLITKQNVLILGKDLVQKINDTTIYVEKMYSPNLTVDNKTFCLSCTIMVTIVICLK